MYPVYFKHFVALTTKIIINIDQIFTQTGLSYLQVFKQKISLVYAARYRRQNIFGRVERAGKIFKGSR